MWQHITLSIFFHITNKSYYESNDILNKIKNIVGVELSEEKVELAEISLKNGTLLVSEEFTKGNAVFIKSKDGEMAHQ